MENETEAGVGPGTKAGNARRGTWARQYRATGDREYLEKLLKANDGRLGFSPLNCGDINPSHYALVSLCAHCHTPEWLDHLLTSHDVQPNVIRHVLRQITDSDSGIMPANFDTGRKLVDRAVGGIKEVAAAGFVTPIWADILGMAVRTKEDAEHVKEQGPVVAFYILEMSANPWLQFKDLYEVALGAIPIEEWGHWLSVAQKKQVLGAKMRKTIGQFVQANPHLKLESIGYVDAGILWQLALEDWQTAVMDNAMARLVAEAADADIRQLDNVKLGYALAKGCSEVRLALNQRLGARAPSALRK